VWPTVNVFSPLGEMMFYGILDILAVPVFGFYHVWALRSIAYEHFMRSPGKASMGYAAAGAAGGMAGAGEQRRTSTASYAPLTSAGGHSAGTGPIMGSAADNNFGPAGGAPVRLETRSTVVVGSPTVTRTAVSPRRAVSKWVLLCQRQTNENVVPSVPNPMRTSEVVMFACAYVQ
jgi:hypothetical protein